jgi:hypothetical protein
MRAAGFVNHLGDGQRVEGRLTHQRHSPGTSSNPSRTAQLMLSPSFSHVSSKAVFIPSAARSANSGQLRAASVVH